MRRKWILGTALAAIVLAAGTGGCAKHAAFMMGAQTDAADSTRPRGPAARGESRLGFHARQAGTGAAPAEVPTAELAASVDKAQLVSQRTLIYTAALQMAVADVETALAAAQKAAEDAGGYMQALTSDSITLRVPAGKFREVLAQLGQLGQTLDKNIQAQDVTDEYVDLQLRLKNAEAMLARLTEILQKAEAVKDILEVERELGRVREEVERIKGRLAVLDKQIAFSTITVGFSRAATQSAKRVLPQNPFPWLDQMGVENVLRIGS